MAESTRQERHLSCQQGQGSVEERLKVKINYKIVKKKTYQARIRRYLSRKNFSFDLRFFQCCYLVLLVFLSALLLSAIFYKLDKGFKRQDNPGSLDRNISSQDPS